MIESGNPTALAVEAAPMRKLWLLKYSPFNPLVDNVCCTYDANLIKGLLSSIGRGDLEETLLQTGNLVRLPPGTDQHWCYQEQLLSQYGTDLSYHI